MAELPLDHPKRVPHLGPNAGLEPLGSRVAAALFPILRIRTENPLIADRGTSNYRKADILSMRPGAEFYSLGRG